MYSTIYKNINNMTDNKILYDVLSSEILKEIDDILGAYFAGKIDFIDPTFDDGEYDFGGTRELVINDKSYTENGLELLVMEWAEGREDTDYLIECLCRGEI